MTSAITNNIATASAQLAHGAQGAVASQHGQELLAGGLNQREQANKIASATRAQSKRATDGQLKGSDDTRPADIKDAQTERSASMNDQSRSRPNRRRDPGALDIEA